eukprot:2964150-Prymnesium_polylepis.1
MDNRTRPNPPTNCPLGQRRWSRAVDRVGEQLSWQLPLDDRGRMCWPEQNMSVPSRAMQSDPDRHIE